MATIIEIDPAVVERRVMELAEIGRCEDTGVCRAVYTPEWVAAQEVVARWFREAGLAVR
jgi:allantoate deiminase